jgi:RNA polymerase sigma factor (sigma-70 family)
MSAVETVSPVASAPASDAELVGAVRGGEDEAFEELFRRYSGRVRKFVARRLGDYGRAEDVTQDVFISALRRMRATESEIAFKPWVFEIARNATIDLHRRTSRTEEVPVDGLELVGSGPPEGEVLARERLAHLRGAFGELNEVQRRGLVMRELEGRSYNEIGDRLQLTRPAVESVLFRARRRLAKEFEALRRAAALLPVPWLLRRRSGLREEAAGSGSNLLLGAGGQAGATLGEQAAALVTAAALAATGGAVLDRDASATRAVPDGSWAPAAPRAADAKPEALRPVQPQQPSRDIRGRDRTAGRDRPGGRDRAPANQRGAPSEPAPSGSPEATAEPRSAEPRPADRPRALTQPPAPPAVEGPSLPSPSELPVPPKIQSAVPPLNLPTPDLPPVEPIVQAKQLVEALKGTVQGG